MTFGGGHQKIWRALWGGHQKINMEELETRFGTIDLFLNEAALGHHNVSSNLPHAAGDVCPVWPEVVVPSGHGAHVLEFCAALNVSSAHTSHAPPLLEFRNEPPGQTEQKIYRGSVLKLSWDLIPLWQMVRGRNVSHFFSPQINEDFFSSFHACGKRTTPVFWRPSVISLCFVYVANDFSECFHEDTHKARNQISYCICCLTTHVLLAVGSRWASSALGRVDPWAECVSGANLTCAISVRV